VEGTGVNLMGSWGGAGGAEPRSVGLIGVVSEGWRECGKPEAEAEGRGVRCEARGGGGAWGGSGGMRRDLKFLVIYII
jgi:hypothetical protein